jgi:DNA-binding response OmpR family regulator
MADEREILLAEDDPDYADLIRIAFHNEGVHNTVQVTGTEEEAKAYLSGTGPGATRAPAVIVLALKTEFLTGFPLLRWIRKHGELRDVPVFVLSGLGLKEEDQLAHDLGSNCYGEKPATFDGLRQIVQQWRDRWIKPSERCQQAR